MSLKWVFLAFFMLFSNMAHALSYTLEIAEDELQKQVAAAMPLEKKWLVFKLVLSNPKVDLVKGSKQIAVQVDVNVSGPAHFKATGQTKGGGELVYDATKGEFHLHDPKLMSLHLDNVSADTQQAIHDLAQAALVQALAKQPLYRLKDDDLKQKLVKAALESVEVKNERLFLHLRL